MGIVQTKIAQLKGALDIIGGQVKAERTGRDEWVRLFFYRNDVTYGRLSINTTTGDEYPKRYGYGSYFDSDKPIRCGHHGNNIAQGGSVIFWEQLRVALATDKLIPEQTLMDFWDKAVQKHCVERQKRIDFRHNQIKEGALKQKKRPAIQGPDPFGIFLSYVDSFIAANK